MEQPSRVQIIDGKIVARCCTCKKVFQQTDMLASLRYCKPCWRSYMRFRRYGISANDYGRMLQMQNGVCAICKRPNHLAKKNGPHLKNLAVDHDRTSKKIRGLLCGRCNRGLGYFEHDPEVLGRAARYLVGWRT